MRRRGLLAASVSCRANSMRLLAEPQTAEHTVRPLRRQSKRVSKSVGARIDLHALIPHHVGALTGHAGGGAAKETATADTAEGEVRANFERTKMDGLLEAAIPISNVLAERTVN